jgi:hypothetical protein
MPATATASKPATPSNAMNPKQLLPAAALAVLLATGCNKKSPEVAAQLAELERKANEAVEKQRQLEQQLAEQKLAAERDAIERERMQIEEDRAELERQQGEAAAAEAEQLRQREIDLAARESKVGLIQSQLEEQEDAIQRRDQELSERDRELAGREALALEDDNRDEPAAPVGDYGMFYDSLTAYGSWFETPDYGYVWQPAIVRDVSWRPYTRGRWVCTDRGWTWVSYEPFGWATYHYGRWALCRGYGWIWVPGSVWAPAWVSWRSGGSQIGWAPLPPESLAWNGGWGSSVDATFCISPSWYCFVETRYFCEPVYNHCLPYHQNHVYFGQSSNCTNIHERNRRIICGGPSYGDIERQTARKPPFYRIEEDRHGRPGRDMRARVEGNRLRVAAPNLDVAWNEGLRPNKIKGRMESVKVERQEELRPEVADRFRQSREENRRKAEQSIAELGGMEKFNQGRMQTLENNRRKVEESARRTETPRDARPPTEPEKVASSENRKPEATGKREDNPRTPSAIEGNPQAREDTKRPGKATEEVAGQARQREEAAKVQDPSVNRSTGPQTTPTRDRSQPAGDTAARPARRDETPRTATPQERNPVADNAAERIRRQREESTTRPGGREEGPRPNPPAAGNRQSQDDAAARMRQQQEEQQAERARQQQQEAARQQQQEAARQREQARQQQLEEARREQQRQQQQEAARQREQARQQQMEEARREQQREQARQQQMEEARREQQREQARQQQMEEARREQQREQARQQQMEEARREQQREQARQQQQEEARREQQREQARQQEEAQRQERSRQEQRQEEERRGRNR